jgi:carbon monoxide dehydrogenase subunit G
MRVASGIEGMRDLTKTKGGCYSALFETKVAFMCFKINVAVEIASIERPNLIEAKIEGQPLGILGRLSVTSSTTLVERGEQTRSSLARFIRNREWLYALVCHVPPSARRCFN